MYHIWIINGEGGCGKDPFINFVAEEIGAGKVLNISTVDYVKELATQFGWKGTKTQEDRKCLSELKYILTYWGDIPFKDVVIKTRNWLEELEEYGVRTGHVFIHCREPKEITKLVNELGAKTILVEREQNILFQNYSDAHVHNYTYDYIVDNNGTLDDLRAEAIKFIEKAED